MSPFYLWQLLGGPRWRYPPRVDFDPGDGKVMMAADGGEKAADPRNERLVSPRLDGVLSE